jgi:hypothetical protein
LPADDTNQCTTAACSAGTPGQTPLTGTHCDVGGSICNAGTCVECNDASDCLGSNDECKTKKCAAHVCDFDYTADGTVVASQVDQDCHRNECNGSGSIVNRVYLADVHDDSNDCTQNLCANNGDMYHPAVTPGSVCAGPQGGRCKDITCTPTFMVVRVDKESTDAAFAGSTGFSVFIERRYLDTAGGQVPGYGPIALPTAPIDAGGALPFVLSAGGGSDGALSLTPDGKYVTLAGYMEAPGTAVTSVTSTAKRMVARIDGTPTGNVDTSTWFASAFKGNNIRSATSSDGERIWAAGASQPSGLGGIWYINRGDADGGTQLTLNTVTDAGAPTTLGNARVVSVVGNQLYGTSDKVPNQGIFAVGSGLPDGGAVQLTSFPGQFSLSPFSFVLLDRDGTPGFDTLYIADESAVGNGGGIQKWILNGGGTWQVVTIFNRDQTGNPMTNGIRHVAGMVTGNSVTLVATTSDAGSGTPPPVKILLYVDDGNLAPTPTLLATAAPNTVFRGVSLAP